MKGFVGRVGRATRSVLSSGRVSPRACTRSRRGAIPTWSKTAALVSEHAALQEALGGCPSVYACYRFAAKLRKHKPLLDACLERVTASLREQLPDYGEDIAIDASDLSAYANGQRYLSKHGPLRERFSDPDASWGHRSAVSTRKGGGFYGHKLHLAACARTDLPIAWTVKTHESSAVSELLTAIKARGFAPETAALDKGYDIGPVYEACHQAGSLPIIPLRQTPAVKRGAQLAPECEHGTWTFAGADFPRKRTKWRCPTGECQPKSLWRKASRLHPLIPRKTGRWRSLYRARAAVEREFGRLKHDYGLAPLRVRGLARVELHTDLVILARLSAALARARAIPLVA